MKSVMFSAIMNSGCVYCAGVKQRIRALRKKFGTLAAIRQCSEEELAQVLPRNVAKQVREYFDAQGAKEEKP